MNYQNWLKIRVIILLLLGIIVIPMEITKAQTNSPSRTNSKPTPVTSQTPNNSKQSPSIWDKIVHLFKARPETPLISRGSICVLSPGILDSKHTIWNTQPFFVWEGIDSPFEVLLYSSSTAQEERKLLWRQTVSEESLKKVPLIYTGTALEPNHIYDWELSISDAQTHLFKFRVMPSPEREHLKADLQALETKLKPAKLTLEEMSLERVNFFAQRNLWSDALREIYAVKNPSPEMIKKKQELVRRLCQ